jgi:hypothetical protein
MVAAGGGRAGKGGSLSGKGKTKGPIGWVSGKPVQTVAQKREASNFQRATGMSAKQAQVRSGAQKTRGVMLEGRRREPIAPIKAPKKK